MAKISKSSMKGNDGKARRKQLQQRILSALVLSTVFLLTMYQLGTSPHIGGIRNNKRMNALRRLGQSRNVRPAKPRSGRGILNMRDALSDPMYDPHKKRQAQKILSASLNLISIEFEDDVMEDDYYEGVFAIFCDLDFLEQKSNPPEQPMFRDVVGHSNCNDEFRQIKVDLSEAVELVREFDMDVATQNLSNGPKVLELKGAVFHESRCGSTLAANSMVALNPEMNRVYSESAPPIAAIKACGEDFSECTVNASANLLKDVVYLMGRSDDPKEEYLFFKFQSLTTRMMQSFRTAFPTTPWMFLYREPVQVMMSHLDGMRHLSGAICVRSKSTSAQIHDFVEREGYGMNDLEDEEFCAIHLATLCESALKNLQEANGVGIAVRYSPDLVHDFLDTIFPKHFKVDLDHAARERVLKVSGTYSKNRGGQEEGAFKSDSESKEEKASDEIRRASTKFLEPSFSALGKSQFNIINMP
ncbi:hypothetical protein ACHAWO_003581 [Cyclotella atomus]|uniref:Sulfotransferase n=1 Tax=Cyclotella atomus TaxID=382360 RepID=A0ABD3NGL3_9STRA